jgi:hypothetical protein
MYTTSPIPIGSMLSRSSLPRPWPSCVVFATFRHQRFLIQQIAKERTCSLHHDYPWKLAICVTIHHTCPKEFMSHRSTYGRYLTIIELYFRNRRHHLEHIARGSIGSRHHYQCVFLSTYLIQVHGKVAFKHCIKYTIEGDATVTIDLNHQRPKNFHSIIQIPPPSCHVRPQQQRPNPLVLNSERQELLRRLANFRNRTTTNTQFQPTTHQPKTQPSNSQTHHLPLTQTPNLASRKSSLHPHPANRRSAPRPHDRSPRKILPKTPEQTRGTPYLLPRPARKQIRLGRFARSQERSTLNSTLRHRSLASLSHEERFWDYGAGGERWEEGEGSEGGIVGGLAGRRVFLVE